MFKWPSMQRKQAQFTTVLLKPWSDQKCERYGLFSDSKSVYLWRFFPIFLKKQKNGPVAFKWNHKWRNKQNHAYCISN